MADKDRQSNPGTEAFVPDFDTDSQPVLSFASLGKKSGRTSGKSGSEKSDAAPAEPEALETPETDSGSEQDDETESPGTPVQSVTVPGRYLYLKWWKFALVVLGVWIGAAEVGLSLYYWWFHTIDKTPAVFVALIYVVVCTVGGVLLSMVRGRPLITALSLAVMSGPFASVAAAAPLYGYYYCEQMNRCLVGVIPY